MKNRPEPAQPLAAQPLGAQPLEIEPLGAEPLEMQPLGAQPLGARPTGALPPDATRGVLKAMSPGVVDFLFRQLVTGGPSEDVQWHKEGTILSAQAPGAELARRLAETELAALTPSELFDYVRAAQRLAAWAEGLREDAVSRYCATPPGGTAPAG
ncbi:hypothetical protein NicSoilB4_12170 [Arthrobacter sp. NicSoilB4]|nr:hypothetical protein NicSoilB4_12170 [Arthrobacter sp. NicSoilB4]